MIARGGSSAGSAQPDPDAERRYALAAAAVGERALQVLGEHVRLDQGGARAVRRTYFDTFDRPLAAGGSILCLEEEDGAHALRWETLDGRLIRRLRTKTEPAFAQDLPAGPFRDELAPHLGVRRLLPLGAFRGEIRRAAVLDARGKTTARVHLERWRVDGRRRAPLTLLRIEPVKGYARVSARIGSVLESELGLLPLDTPAYMRQLGLAPAVGKSPAAAILPGMRSDEAAKHIYAGLLDVICAHEQGTRERTDPEFLHQFRVAIRRTRAGIARLKGLFPVRVMERFKREFAWLGRVTGPMRDLDVHLLELPAYRAALPADVHADLDPLRHHLERAADAAQAQLEAALTSARYRRLVDAWRAWLAEPVPVRTTLPDARRPIEELAAERIGKLHRRVLKRGLAIDDDTPAEDVHVLRLDCKKLRYLMEFFRDLFDAKAMKQQIRALKNLQEVLGRFNDFEVQQGALGDAVHAMSAAGDVPLDTVVVMGRLIETSRRRQDEARAEVCGRIARYASPENRTRAERLFTPTRTEVREA